MTALDRFIRLESEALWRATPDGQRRDVTISFGDATLVIADGSGRPLAHWSLPALDRQNPGEMPAIYVPDDDASETLEIADTTMVDAIEEVRKALAKARPHPGTLRYWLTAGLIIVTLALAIFWLPGALTRQTLAIVPPTKRAEIGAEMLRHIEMETGRVCQSTRAATAAARLSQRLFPQPPAPQIVVVPQLASGALALPGNLIVLDGEMLQQSDDPAIAAGFILDSHTRAQALDPLETVLDQEGLGLTFRLLTTGDIPSATLRRNARAALTAAPQGADTIRLRRAFADAQIPLTPYLNAVDQRTGTMPDLGDDPMTGRSVPLILPDTDWVSLQNICNS